MAQVRCNGYVRLSAFAFAPSSFGARDFTRGCDAPLRQLAACFAEEPPRDSTRGCDGEFCTLYAAGGLTHISFLFPSNQTHGMSLTTPTVTRSGREFSLYSLGEPVRTAANFGDLLRARMEDLGDGCVSEDEMELEGDVPEDEMPSVQDKVRNAASLSSQLTEHRPFLNHASATAVRPSALSQIYLLTRQPPPSPRTIAGAIRNSGAGSYVLMKTRALEKAQRRLGGSTVMLLSPFASLASTRQSSLSTPAASAGSVSQASSLARRWRSSKHVDTATLRTPPRTLGL